MKMKMEDCIFCKIANKLTDTELVYEDDKVSAFDDIKPKAPVHILIVPKKHIESVNHVEIEDKNLMGDLILAAQKIARQKDLVGYNLHINVGRPAGQLVDHLHIHLESGR